jgi:hypothetical protein
VVIGHGAHFMCGVETYQGKTIFYNLGSLMMEFESGNSIIPPEMYAEYGLDEHAKPSQLHRKRSVDDEENFIVFNAYPKFSQNIILEIDVDEGKNPIKRGLPNIPNSELAQLILKRLNKISQPLNTQLSYDQTNNTFIFD